MISKKDRKELWHEDFDDLMLVLKPGAIKHGARNWEKGNQGNKSSFKEMHDSIWHHIAESWSQGVTGKFHGTTGGYKRADEETGVDPLLHAACRCLMLYSLIKRNKYE